MERRCDRVEFVPDLLLQTQAIGGQGGPITALNGSARVTDYFAELRVPLVQDAPFADQLNLDMAYRYSDYEDLTTDTYKIGMDWAPIEDIRFRGSFQRAVRAANVIELFTAQGFNLFDMPADGDPCGPAQTATLQQCLDTGVPAAFYGNGLLVSPAGQYSFLQGGNPDLAPEESDTYTYGVILQPRFLPKLAMSIDYFDIEITDAVSTFGPENAIIACYENNDPLACANIDRDPATGALWIGDGHVSDLNINTGGFETKGWDLSLTYSGVEIGGFGSLNFNLTGTLLDELVEDPGGGFAPFDCAGIYSGECGAGRGSESRMAASLPHRLGIAVECRRVPHLALLRLGRAVPRERQPGAVGLRTRRAKLLRPDGGVARDREGLGAPGYQQRPGRGSSAQ